MVSHLHSGPFPGEAVVEIDDPGPPANLSEGMRTPGTSGLRPDDDRLAQGAL